MKKILISLLALISFFAMNSCKDIIETNISKSTITILAPADTATISSSNVTFWWNTVDGALKYNIQIVKPNFNSVQTLFVDSNVTTNKFNYTLDPGSYQWRIKAINGSTSTAYFTRSFKVDSSLDLSGSSIQLTTPASGFSSSSFTIALYWLPLSAATSYNLQVQNQLTGATNTISSISNTNYSYAFSSYGSYKWRVWAENATSQSKYSNWNTINIAIPTPSLSAPIDRDTTIVYTPVSFSWSSTSNTNSTVYSDTIYIYSDTIGSVLVDHGGTNTKTYSSYAEVTKKWYSWKVRTVDNAGNTSGFSPLRKFKTK